MCVYVINGPSQCLFKLSCYESPFAVTPVTGFLSERLCYFKIVTQSSCTVHTHTGVMFPDSASSEKYVGVH